MGDERRTASGTFTLPRVDRALDSTRGTRDELAPRAGAHLHPEPLDDTAVLQVFFDDLVDVRLVDIGVPDRVGIDDDAGTFLAAVEAARLIDADLAFAREAELLDALLRVVADLGGALVVAADAAAVALVAAEKHVPGI